MTFSVLRHFLRSGSKVLGENCDRSKMVVEVKWWGWSKMVGSKYIEGRTHANPFLAKNHHFLPKLENFPKNSLTGPYFKLWTRLLIIDEHSRGYIYSAVDDSLLEIDNLPPTVSGCLWDAEDGHVFAIWDTHNQLYTYTIHDQHIDGEKIEFVASGRKPKGQTPLLLSGGFLFLQTNSGKLNRITLPSHRFLTPNGPVTEEDLENALSLRKWANAHIICSELDIDDAWNIAGQGTGQ